MSDRSRACANTIIAMYKSWVGMVMSVRGVCRSEHEQNVSKWRPTMSLATECLEKFRSEYLKLR